MSHEFRLKFQQMQENAPARENPANKTHADFYEQSGHARNVCFVLLDGYRTFLNYAYLVSGEYLPQQNRIILAFTSHLVTLTGIWLEELYYAFMHHLPKQVQCIDARYNATAGDDDAIVNEIVINKNE